MKHDVLGLEVVERLLLAIAVSGLAVLVLVAGTTDSHRDRLASSAFLSVEWSANDANVPEGANPQEQDDATAHQYYYAEESDSLAAGSAGTADTGSPALAMTSAGSPVEGRDTTIAADLENAAALPEESAAGPQPDPEIEATQLTLDTAAVAVPVLTPASSPVRPRQPIQPKLRPQYPNVEYTYYDVAGTTSQEVRDRVTKAGPSDGRGHRWASTTNWSLDWKAKIGGNGNSTDVEVSYRAKVTLPRWIPPANAPADDVQRWQAYVESLAKHENGHVEILVSSLPAITNALKAANKGNAQTVFDSEFKRLSQRQDEYDARTHDGIE